ncbi:MAG: TonB-dependent receptor [Bacteroidales bacterium]|nr:TonB-dependent receptor [Bacteroidales bacterium]
MRLSNIYILIFFTFLSLFSYSQKATISGFVTDQNSKERLIGVNVFEKQTYKGVSSNAYGFYSITLPLGKHQIIYSYVGYTPMELTLDLTKDTVFQVNLIPVIELQGVEVKAHSAEEAVRSSQVGLTHIPVQTIKNLPVFMGEPDVIKAIQLLPGVQSGSEGSSGMYVRGGGPEQNLILLDGVPVYNVNHLFGFFSVFNPDAVNSVTLIKGGFPARYGGRLSSVLDIRMKEGNQKELKGSASVGLISSRATIEGPIDNGKGSFIISGRRTYIDVLMQPLIRLMAMNEGIDRLKAGYYFYDLNGKVNYKLSEKSHIYLSSYLGRDKFYAGGKESYDEQFESSEFTNDMKLGWGNITNSLRWNYLLNDNLFSNTTLTFSDYRFVTGVSYEETNTRVNMKEENKYGFEYNSGIRDWGLRSDFDYSPIPDHQVKFGVSAVTHKYNPGVNVVEDTESQTTIDTTFGNTQIHSLETDLYIEDDFEFGGIFKSNIGLHYSTFSVKKTFYHALQPRLSVRAMLSDRWSVKAAYSQMNQYLHLLTNSTMGMPTDLWVPVTDVVKPMESVQYALGAYYKVTEGIHFSIEAYYKSMDNVLEYKEGASYLSLKDNWEQKIEQGDGRSYGLELLLKKDDGDTRGWIGYTLSWTDRQFVGISNGEIFPYRYDRRHDIGIVLTHKFSDRFDIGATWVYGTGYAFTLPLEQYWMPGFHDLIPAILGGMGNDQWMPEEHFEHRNNYRMPAYHRMDIGFNRRKDVKYGKRTWSFGLYNAYSRKNTFFMMLNTSEVFNGGKTKLRNVSLLPIPIPFVSYRLEI